MKLGTRVWGLIAFVVSVGVLAAGWFLGVSPLLAARSLAEQQRADAVAQNEGIATKIATLATQKEKLSDYEKRADELEVMIPSGIKAADFIRSLNDLAGASNVQIESITLGDPLKYAAPSGEPADEQFAPNPVTDSRITSENFLLVPVSVGVKGGWNEVLAFTHGVQTSSRLMLVTTVNTSEDQGSFTTTLAGTMYVLVRPNAPATAAGGDTASDSDPASEG
ncbi:MAG: type 4a pilus biogenesis protein PilO [Protaetiibacter sp.]